MPGYMIRTKVFVCLVYFTPSGVERQASHTLEVQVKEAKVEIRARRGYVWR